MHNPEAIPDLHAIVCLRRERNLQVEVRMRLDRERPFGPNHNLSDGNNVSAYVALLESWVVFPDSGEPLHERLEGVERTNAEGNSATTCTGGSQR